MAEMPSTPERRVLGELSNTKTEPVSPTANLRLLTSLASNLKSVSRSSDRDNNQNSQNTTQQDEFSPVASGSVGSKLLPRKQKSLGILCNKFLDLYPLNIENGALYEISLDSTAKALGTEKRRIYDIINVLESLDMALKAGKNRYLWHGQNNLTSTLVRLKSTAIRLGLREQIQEIQKTSRAYIGDNDDSSYSCELPMSQEEPVDEDSYDSDAAIKEDKSLGAMCQKFIMLFLISMKNGVINLEIAAKVLILDMDNQSEMNDVTSRSHFRTKVRRLYDIANVLTAIGLIKKVYMYDRAMKKPIFKYIGPEVESTDTETGTPIHHIYDSPVGMSTPSKRITPLTRSIPSNNSGNSDIKTLRRVSDTTPIIDKRKPRKRKLFEADSPFPRTYSLPNLEKNRSTDRLDDSILRVAAMELEKLNSSEELKPKACTKLFPRYNSDSCLGAVNHIETEKLNESIVEINPPNQTVSIIKIPLVIHNTKNLVSKLSITPTATFYVKNGTVIQRPIINTSCVPVNKKAKNNNSSSETTTTAMNLLKPVKHKIMKLLPIGSVVTHGDGSDSKKIIIPRTITKDKNNDKNDRIPCYTVQETKPNTPKIINLTKIDPKKLIPISGSDLKKMSLTTAKKSHQVTLEKINNTNTNYAMLTPIQASKLSPGDTFKAIKVGNTLQLVPFKSKSDENSNHESSEN